MPTVSEIIIKRLTDNPGAAYVFPDGHQLCTCIDGVFHLVRFEENLKQMTEKEVNELIVKRFS